MRWLIAFVARLYPRSWRAEFGAEFDAVLGDVRPRWRVLADVLGGAITMQITDGTGWLKVVGVMALVGAVVGGGVGFRVPSRFESSTVISVTPQVDPVRPTSRQALNERAAARALEIKGMLLSRWNLSATVRDLDLYRPELKDTPLIDVIERMRRDIRIEARPTTDGGPLAVSISFSYPDRIKAQAVVRQLANKFIEENVDVNRFRDMMYRDFWQYMSAYEQAKPAPPPPLGAIVHVLHQANSTEAKPNRVVFLAWGLGAGLLLGLLAALVMRWPHGVMQLGGFAAAGCVLAAAVSFAIPSRYTSTAVMEISGAQITEDPFAPLPLAPLAAETLRQMETELLSTQSLSRIIEDPRNNLYASERAKKPIGEVVRNMLASDLRIAPLNPGSSAFSISFSYSDRFKAQGIVQAVMNRIDELNQNRQKATADASRDVVLRRITQRKAGEVLEVLDTASLPVTPAGPHRLVIVVFGLGVGLLVGGIGLWIGRSLTRSAGAGENAYAT